MSVISPGAQWLGNEAEVIDALPAPLRDLVHEFGWSVVRAFLDAKITRPETIRHLIYTVWLGSREPGNKRAARPEDQGRSLASLDQFLIRTSPIPSARGLIGAFHRDGLALLPLEPSDKMVETSGTSRERLRAALRNGERAYWPFLYQ